MGRLAFDLETKAVDEDGTIEGLAAGYGNVDYGGDMIMPGALARSLRGRKSIPMLMFHDMTRPAGVWTGFEETPKGLKVSGRFAMKTMQGQEAHALVVDGAIGALSIGYATVKEQVVDKVRQLKEILLHEVSLVTIGMNPAALVTRAKAFETIEGAIERLKAGERLTERDWEALLKAQGLSNAEAERAIRKNFNGQAEPAVIGQGEPDASASLFAELAKALA